ncbi:MAG: hypothetical protein RLZZ601_1201, partial [Pseudomonadota bacterium]
MVMNGITTIQGPEWNDKRWLWLLSPTIPFAFTASILAFVLTGH